MTEIQKIPFRLSSIISDFDKALSEDVAIAIKEQRKAVLPGDNVFGYTHGTRWHTRTTETNEENEINEMQRHSTEVEISFQDILDNDLEALARYRNTLVSGMMQELMSVIYQTVSESTEKTGNVVNAKGGGFKAEQFIEMLQKIEFGVDRDGNVSFPEIHAGPELAEKMLKELSSQGPEFEKRVQEITREKSEAALKREAGRKSKFPSRGAT
jgi:hypothetical protein